MLTKDDRGRFVPGNPGGPGRPPAPTERTYLLALQAACPLERWQRIVDRAVADAEGGDAKARDWLARYLVGVPSPTPTTLLALAVEALAGVDELERRALALGLEHRKELSATRLAALIDACGP